jgi:uncharacterized protein
MIQILQPGDEAQLERFLRRYADSSQFLRSNALVGGLRDEGRPYQGTYAARIEGGEITAVVAQVWNGNLLLQAPAGAVELARAALRRPIGGVIGPWEQVTEVLNGLGLAAVPATLNSREILYGLELSALRVPPSLESGALRCRRSAAAELDQLVAWRREFRVEAIGETDGPALLETSREQVTRSLEGGNLFVLLEQERPVATCSFNAWHPESVQIGGVWTPRATRSRGYARSVVAGALLIARSEGVTRSVLFTGETNAAAQTAYQALGYARIGDYGLVLFREPVTGTPPER